MELDLLGTHEDGIFILELKVNRSAERNAFSELFAYSNYLAEMFALSGHKDITNVLVANLDAKITRHAFLYDLLIADRNVIVYQPEFTDGTPEGLRLHLYLPSDDDFQHFTNRLLSHDAMACVVASFEDIPGWIDSGEIGGNVPEHTVANLHAISGYAAQLMEAEGLHGFCFMRKRWREIPTYYPNSLIVCAVNPFEVTDADLSLAFVEQLDKDRVGELVEFPKLAFHGRLLRLARRALNDTLTVKFDSELENPLWSSMVSSFIEVVFTHNMAFHPTGLLREAYVSVLDATYGWWPSSWEHHRSRRRGIDWQDIFRTHRHRRHHSIWGCLCLGRCKRRTLAGIRSRGEHCFETAAMAPHVGRAQTEGHRQTVVAAGAGIESN
jgi:hypothetical protein